MSLAPQIGKVIFNPLSTPRTDFDRFRGRIIVLEGVMGTGKSLLGRSIAYHLNKRGVPARFFEEHVNKEYLDLYLSDKRKHAFSFQTVMVNRRIDRHIHEIVPYVATGGVAIVDRHILGDIAFEMAGFDDGFITPEEHEAYWSMLKKLRTFQEPDYTVYLHCDPEEGIQRIHLRGNKSEIAAYKPEDLIKIADLHHRAFKDNNVRSIYVDHTKRLYIKDHGHLRWTNVSKILLEILEKGNDFKRKEETVEGV